MHHTCVHLAHKIPPVKRWFLWTFLLIRVYIYRTPLHVIWQTALISAYNCVSLIERIDFNLRPEKWCLHDFAIVLQQPAQVVRGSFHSLWNMFNYAILAGRPLEPVTMGISSPFASVCDGFIVQAGRMKHAWSKEKMTNVKPLGGCMDYDEKCKIMETRQQVWIYPADCLMTGTASRKRRWLRCAEGCSASWR